MSGKQGDIFERDTGRFERRQALVAEGMRVQLRQLERGAQRFDYVIEAPGTSGRPGLRVDSEMNSGPRSSSARASTRARRS